MSQQLRFSLHKKYNLRYDQCVSLHLRAQNTNQLHFETKRARRSSPRTRTLVSPTTVSVKRKNQSFQNTSFQGLWKSISHWQKLRVKAKKKNVEKKLLVKAWGKIINDNPFFVLYPYPIFQRKKGLEIVTSAISPQSRKYLMKTKFLWGNQKKARMQSCGQTKCPLGCGFGIEMTSF